MAITPNPPPRPPAGTTLSGTKGPLDDARHLITQLVIGLAGNLTETSLLRAPPKSAVLDDLYMDQAKFGPRLTVIRKADDDLAGSVILAAHDSNPGEVEQYFRDALSALVEAKGLPVTLSSVTIKTHSDPTGDVGGQRVDYSGSRTDLHVFAKFARKEASSTAKPAIVTSTDGEDFH